MPLISYKLGIDTSVISAVGIFDTLEFKIYDSWGKCLGSGPSGIKTFEKNYQKNYPLSKGSYLLNIIHGMRTDSLQGMKDIGFKIKK